MKHLTAAVALILFVAATIAQERVPAEEAQKIAKHLAETAGKLNDAQIKTEVDPDKPFALKKGEHAAMVIPDKKLSADALAKAGKDIVPVGQLWCKNLTTVVNGNPTPSNSLRVVTIMHDGQDIPLQLFFLGVRKKGDELEMLVYAKEKEPLLTLPVTKADSNQELPIEFEPQKSDTEKRGFLVLKLLGKYQAKFPVAPQE